MSYEQGKALTTWLGVIKDLLNLLEGFVGCLGEHEQDVQEHGGAEDGKEDVGLPGDPGKSRGHKVGEGKVESPVGRGAESDSLAAEAQGEKFGRVGPRDRAPGWCIRRDKEVSRSDNGLGGGSRHSHRLGSRGELAGKGWVRVDGKDSRVDTEPEAHQKGTNEKGWATAPAIHPEEGRHSHTDVDDEVDAAGEQDSIAASLGEPRHGEDVGNVVHLEEQVSRCPDKCVDERD